jgi:hypothetical protein
VFLSNRFCSKFQKESSCCVVVCGGVQWLCAYVRGVQDARAAGVKLFSPAKHLFLSIFKPMFYASRITMLRDQVTIGVQTTGPFRLVGTSLVLIDGGVLDHELEDWHAVTVTLTDNGNPGRCRACPGAPSHQRRQLVGWLAGW